MGFKEIQKLAATVEQACRNDGYILVQVILPPQEINHLTGNIQLRETKWLRTKVRQSNPD